MDASLVADLTDRALRNRCVVWQPAVDAVVATGTLAMDYLSFERWFEPFSGATQHPYLSPDPES